MSYTASTLRNRSLTTYHIYSARGSPTTRPLRSERLKRPAPTP